MYGNHIQRTLGVKQILPVITIGTSTVKGVGYDRTGYLSGSIVYAAGICPSVPTGFTVVLKVQDSADDVDGNYADFATIAKNIEAVDSTSVVYGS